MPFTIGFSGFALTKSLHHWINDGLMAIFFFVVGLEIKREVLVGELAKVSQAALPIAGALGGMLVPAGLYALLNAGAAGSAGWGIPMATDIAFALGVLTLLGPRIPLGLKVFLTALAIVDDLGAVLVIAFFYTAEISWGSLGLAAFFLLLLFFLSWAGVRKMVLYALLGFCLWVAVLKSGIHATIAGVLLAMTIPARPRLNPQQFLQQSQKLLNEFDQADDYQTDKVLISESQQSIILALEQNCEKVETPMQRLEHGLHPWVTYLILPLFALANSGVHLGSDAVNAWGHKVSLGIMAGLVIGKPLGIFFFSWLALRLGWATLPAGVTYRHLLGAGMLGGIGFTMSLFVASLAFGTSALLEISKMGILSASIIAGVLGWAFLRFGKK